MGDQFCLIGPYKEQSARTEVEEADFPPHSPLHQAVRVLRDQGYKVSPSRDNRFRFPVFPRIRIPGIIRGITRLCPLDDALWIGTFRGQE